ncbi:hypothetical protein GCM10010399_39540 [Dactylosporangium fulvum]|uniref:DUF4244 domain-containing protein n=1 Tax=Dactylosporangium fulvum TaxID=53359 RepID=A0ABY5W0J9_9ACTN|nr:DUF4244 domain-containing protein [Dactylosporangium fulvum]UWP82959.1 DUF4244 domain-containing protein [Dactylosporangium fulvum]
MHSIRTRLRLCRLGDAGVTTAEYAICMLVGVGLAGVLLKVVLSDSTRIALTNIIGRALT